MAPMVSDAQLPTGATEEAVLPCPHFEGVEKRIEIDFHDGRMLQGTFFYLPSGKKKNPKKP